MDQALIQRTRYQLRARFRRVETSPDGVFELNCAQLFHWLSNHPLLANMLEELKQNNDEETQKVRGLFEVLSTHSFEYGSLQYPLNYYSVQTNVNHAAVCLAIVTGIVKMIDLEEGQQSSVYMTLGVYLTRNFRIKGNEVLPAIKDIVIQGLYEYLDERLDDRNAIYAILVKYKQRSEWFRKLRLREYALNGLESKTGERALAIDVQEYLLDQGVEFFVEPASASGEADLILKSSEGRYLVIDTKFIHKETTKSAIANKLSAGVHQVMSYCRDFNVQEGFLVNFMATPTRINLELEYNDGLPYLNIGGKIIYYIEIHIADEPSASKLGKANEVTITVADLLADDTNK